MNKLFKLSFGAVLGILIATSITGCKKDKNGQIEEDTKYSAILCVGAWPNTAYYIANFNSLTSGEISIKGNGAELTGKVYAQDVIQKDGYYYHANSTSGRIGKYHTENGALITDKEVSFTWLDWDSYTWINNNTLAIFGVGSTNETQPKEARYAIVNVTDMTIKTGKLNFESLPAGFTTYRISFAEYRENKLFLGYSFASEDWSQWPIMNIFKQFNVAVVNYSNMATEKNLSVTTTISATPTVYAPTSFIDENNDIYFITDPVSGYDYESPSLVYRIKNGTTDLDASYSFNLSEKTNNGMGAAMWYIGNGKAIVRTRVAGESIDADHSFSVINAQTGTFIKKLDLPADKGERMVNAVIVEDGNAFIAVNAVDRDYIWQYNPTTDVLTKGAEFVGGIDYILRIEKKK